jgi:hypothetical protein
LGAKGIGITIGMGTSVPMACISAFGVGNYRHSPGFRPYLSRARRPGITARLVMIGEQSRKINRPNPSRPALDDALGGQFFTTISHKGVR